MNVLKCKPSAQFAYNYSINVLSKCSNIIFTSIFEGQHIDHRSSKVDTSTSEGRHIDLRKSTHRSSKVHTFSIFEHRHIDHRSSRVDTSNHPSSNLTPISEGRHIDLRRSKVETSHRQFFAEYCQQWLHSLYPKIPYDIISDEVTHALT